MRRIGGCGPAHALRQSVSCEHPRVRGRRPRRGPPPTRNLESWTMARGRRGATRRATPSSCRCHCGTADRASEDPDLRKGPVALRLGRPRCARGRLRAWRGLTRIRSSTRERPKRDSETIGDGETARRRTRWASGCSRPTGCLFRGVSLGQRRCTVCVDTVRAQPRRPRKAAASPPAAAGPAKAAARAAGAGSVLATCPSGSLWSLPLNHTSSH